MFRLLRTTLGLLALAIGCISLAISTNNSLIEWGCLRFLATGYNLDGLIDADHGIYFIENPSIPQKYIPAVLWVQMNNGLMAYYTLFTSTGNQRDGIVDSARSYGYIDSGSKFDVSESIYSISPDLKYLAFKSVNHISQDQSMILRDATTFTPLVSVKVSGNLNSRDISQYTVTNDYPSDWSSTYEWLAFTTFQPQSATLTLLSSRTGETQSLAIDTGMPFRKIIWSPEGTSLAVLGGGFTTNLPVMLYRKLDIIALKNDRWQVIHSYDTGIPDQVYTSGGLEEATWAGSGDAFSVLRLNKDSGYSVLTFHLRDTVTETTIPLANNTNRPIFIFSGEWVCQLDTSRTHANLIAITEAQPTIVVPSDCLFLSPAPDQSTWLIKQISPEYPEGRWLTIRTSPFSMSSLNIPAKSDTILAWSHDSQKAFFRLPYNPYFSDGQLGIVDINTGQWKLFPDHVAMTNITISPDSSRYTVWAADMSRLLLVDIENHVIAAIPNTIAQSYPDNVTLKWSPDSSRFLLTDTDLNGQGLVNLISRDGERLRTIKQPRQATLWLPQWSHCEPTPKLPRLNLPQ